MNNASLSEEPPGVVGLRNLGNSCYLNVIVQCLSVVNPFAECLATRDYVSETGSDDSSDHSSSQFHGSKGTNARETMDSLVALQKRSTDGLNVDRFKLTNALADLLRSMWSGQYDVSSLIGFKNIVGQCHAEYAEKREQDAQEFLLFLLNTIHDELMSNFSTADKPPRHSIGSGADKNRPHISQPSTKQPFLRRLVKKGVGATDASAPSSSLVCKAPMASRIEALFAGMQSTQIVCPNPKCKRSISRSPFPDSTPSSSFAASPAIICSKSKRIDLSNGLRFFPPRRHSPTDVIDKPRTKITATALSNSDHPNAGTKQELFFCLSLPIPARNTSTLQCNWQPNSTNVVQFTWVPICKYDKRLVQFTIDVHSGDKLSDVYIKVRQAIAQLNERSTLTGDGFSTENEDRSGSLGQSVGRDANTTMSSGHQGKSSVSHCLGSLKYAQHLDSHQTNLPLRVNTPLVIVQTTMHGFGSWYLDTSEDAIHLLHETSQHLHESWLSNSSSTLIPPGLYVVELPWQPSAGSIHDRHVTRSIPIERGPSHDLTVGTQLTDSWYDNLARNDPTPTSVYLNRYSHPLTSARFSVYDNTQPTMASSDANNADLSPSLYPRLNAECSPSPYAIPSVYMTEEDPESQPAALLQLLLLHVIKPGGSWPPFPSSNQNAVSNRLTRLPFIKSISSDQTCYNNDDRENREARIVPLSFPQTLVVPRSFDFDRLQAQILQCLVDDLGISGEHLFHYETGEDFQLTFCVVDAGPDEEGYQLSMASGHEYPLLYSSIDSSSVPLSDPLVIGEQLGQASVRIGYPSLVRLLVIWPDIPIIHTPELTSPSLSLSKPTVCTTFSRQKSRDESFADNGPKTIAQSLFDRMSTFLTVQLSSPPSLNPVRTAGDTSDRSLASNRSFFKAFASRRTNQKGSKKGDSSVVSASVADATSEGSLTLLDCLKIYTASQELGDADVWHCPGCRGPQPKARLCTVLNYLPDFLFVHLKRFEHSVLPDGPSNVTSAVASVIRTLSEEESTLPAEKGAQRTNFIADSAVPPTINQTKRTDFVDFPIRGLDLSNFVQPSNKADRQNRCLVYDLIAVCNHKGDLNSGHYTSFCLSTVDGKWRSFDDTRVTVLSEDQIVQPWAYVLVYQRRSQPTLPVGATRSDHWTYARRVCPDVSVVCPQSGLTSLSPKTTTRDNIQSVDTDGKLIGFRRAVQLRSPLDNQIIQKPTTAPDNHFAKPSRRPFTFASDETSSYTTVHQRYPMDPGALVSKSNETETAPVSHTCSADTYNSEWAHQYRTEDQKDAFEYHFQRGPRKIYDSSDFICPISPVRTYTKTTAASPFTVWTPPFADNTLSNPLDYHTYPNRQSDV